MTTSINFKIIATGKNEHSPESIDGILACLKNKTVLTLSEPITPDRKSVFELTAKNIDSHANFIASFIRRMDLDMNFEAIKIGDEITPILRKVAETKSAISIKIGDETIVTDFDMIPIRDIDGKIVTISILDLCGATASRVEIPADGMYGKNPTINYIYKKLGLSAHHKWPTDKLIESVKKARKSNLDLSNCHFVMSETYVTTYHNKRVSRSNEFWIPMSLIVEAESETGVSLFKKK